MRASALEGMGAVIGGRYNAKAQASGGLREMIAELTGVEPVTCPWRVYEDPVVQAGMKLRRRIADGVVDVDQQPAVVLEAAEMIGSIQDHIEAIDARKEREQRESERRIRDAQRGPQR